MVAEQRQVKVTQSRDMWPFQFLFSTANLQFNESKRRFDFGDKDSPNFDIYKCEGWQKFKASGLVFLFFWYECYLNYALSIICADEYEFLERRSVTDKQKLISKKLSLTNMPDVSQLKKFRESLAHGKNLTHASEKNMALASFHEYDANISNFNFGETDWEEFLTTVDTNKLIDTLAKFLEEIMDKAGLDYHPRGASDIRTRGAEIAN